MGNTPLPVDQNFLYEFMMNLLYSYIIRVMLLQVVLNRLSAQA